MPRDHIAAAHATDVAAIEGLKELWGETLGDPRVCIAILDGPVDQSHPSLAAADLTRLETLVSGLVDRGPASQHGTHIASIVFGQHAGPIAGIAPRCRGLIVPVFRDAPDGSLAPCSQLDLSRAIVQSVQAGAQIINISGGQLSPSGDAHPLLADAVRFCTANDVLIIAAAGNDGCNCLHLPSAMPSVLAVGAMNAQGAPLAFSNWGESYQTQGILAPGENIKGASVGGGTVTNCGTSYATPIVSGIAALLLSMQLTHGERHPQIVRAAILRTAVGCEVNPVPDCRRLLVGRLNVKGAMYQVMKGGRSMMSNSIEMQDNPSSRAIDKADLTPPPVETTTDGVQALASSAEPPAASGRSPGFRESNNSMNQDLVNASRINASKCACGGGDKCTCGANVSAQLVFALGQLGYDFGTEARRDSIMQHMPSPREGTPPNPHDPNQLLAYLDKNPWDATAIIWTLSLDATPIYAIRTGGAFASEIYQRLREFLRDQIEGALERISIAGHIAGQARLFTGQVVPVIWPDLRCMYSWKTADLLLAICGKPPADAAGAQKREAYVARCDGVANFLERVYHELRNLGVTSQERAINFSATNALNVGKSFESALKDETQLDTIDVQRSPICRPDSDCWDVKLTFFNPKKVFEQARKVYRFTVDVSDVCPVMVGPMRSWFVR